MIGFDRRHVDAIKGGENERPHLAHVDVVRGMTETGRFDGKAATMEGRLAWQADRIAVLVEVQTAGYWVLPSLTGRSERGGRVIARSTAIDHEADPVINAGIVGGKEDDALGDIFRPTEPSDRMAFERHCRGPRRRRWCRYCAPG